MGSSETLSMNTPLLQFETHISLSVNQIRVGSHREVIMREKKLGFAHSQKLNEVFDH